jgi:hypothetical protein
VPLRCRASDRRRIGRRRSLRRRSVICTEHPLTHEGRQVSNTRAACRASQPASYRHAGLAPTGPSHPGQDGAPNLSVRSCAEPEGGRDEGPLRPERVTSVLRPARVGSAPAIGVRDRSSLYAVVLLGCHSVRHARVRGVWSARPGRFIVRLFAWSRSGSRPGSRRWPRRRN